MAGEREVAVNLTEAQKVDSFWVRIKLTDDQRSELSEAFGQDVEEIEIPVRHEPKGEIPRVIIRKPLVTW